MSRIPPVRLAFYASLPEKDFNEDLNPIICLHGLMGFKEYFQELSKLLANATKRKVYAFDARNHGDSEWTDSYHLDMNVDDLLHFMDDMGIKKAILIGQSMGGNTAIRAALKSPDQIEKIFVEDMGIEEMSDDVLELILTMVKASQTAVEALPPELDDSEAKELFLKTMFSEIMKKPKHILESFKGMIGENTKAFTPDVLKLRRKEDGKFAPNSNFPVIERMLENKELKMSPPEGLYHGPACFIYGDLSSLDVGGQESVIKKHFPNATFVAVKGAAHAVSIDKPEEFKDALLKFLS